MNQEYRGRVERHLNAGGDPKYVNVKRKAEARHEAGESKHHEAKEKALGKMKESYVHPDTVKYMKKNKLGMFGKADKKLVKENTPPKYK